MYKNACLCVSVCFLFLFFDSPCPPTICLFYFVVVVAHLFSNERERNKGSAFGFVRRLGGAGEEVEGAGRGKPWGQSILYEINIFSIRKYDQLSKSLSKAYYRFN